MKDFGNRLRVRAANHHAKCTVCIKHRLIVKQLGRGPARTAQLGLYRDHLKRQYCDRQTYWAHRSESRHEASCGNTSVKMVSMVIDGMDAAKHSYPKAECLQAKEFASWVKPKMQNTTIICHGHAVLIGLSPQSTPGSSSRSIELISHMMSYLAKPKPDMPPSYQIQWSNVFLHLQADNASKELKHQTSLRVFSTKIAAHSLRGCQLAFLQSGHSHEDIDMFFSLTASWIQRHPILENIGDFKSCLKTFLENKSVRVNEPHREVVVFDSFHDWFLGKEIHRNVFCVFCLSYNFSKSFHRKPPDQLVSSCFIRKSHYGIHCGSAHLRGIGGAGAPHLFRLERIGDTGSKTWKKHEKQILLVCFSSTQNLLCCFCRT